MKKQIGILLVLLGLATSSAWAFGPAYWNRCKGDQCGASGGGGGEIPTPFDAFNQRAELADGEDYLLVGRVIIENVSVEGSRAYFEVDLDQHRWLASAKRKADPRYPLEGSVGFWKLYRGLRIKLPCLAVQQITVTGQQKPEATIWLRHSRTNPIEPM